MKRLRLAALGFLLPIFFLAISSPAAGAFDLFGRACSGANAKNSPACQTPTPTQDPALHTINAAANVIALAAGIAAVIMIIIGGLTMVTSAGNTEAVASARRRVLNSAIGLVIVALAWTIVRFVADKLIQ